MESNNIAIEENSSSPNDEAQHILKSQQTESNDVASSLCGSFDSILPSTSDSQVNIFCIFLFSNKD